MGDMTVAAGRGVFFLLHQGLGMGPLEITLVFLGVTPLASLIIVEEGGGSAEEFWIRMFSSFFFDIRMAL
jgi:hypothetical protein